MSKDDELAVIGTMCQPLRRMPRGDKSAAVSMMCPVFRRMRSEKSAAVGIMYQVFDGCE